MIGFQLFNWFQLFSFKNVSQKVARQRSEQVKNDHFEMGSRWFQLFFIDFSYYTPRNEVVGGYTGFTMSVRLSVRL